jgi:ketosteroid isomerase-like protein
VKDFYAAIGSGDAEALLALVAEDIEWIIPRSDWALAGTRAADTQAGQQGTPTDHPIQSNERSAVLKRFPVMDFESENQTAGSPPAIHVETALICALLAPLRIRTSYSTHPYSA